MPRSRRPNLTQVKSIAYQPLEKNNVSLRDDELLDENYKYYINNVNINVAYFTYVLISDDALSALCPIAEGINSITGRSTKDTLDCA